MPIKRNDTYQLIDRELIIYKRPDSAHWQCRYKLDEKWYHVTTKERELAKAKKKAHRIFIAAEVRKEQQLPVISKMFRDVATLAVQRMDAETAAGNAPVSYEQYKRITKDFLIPYFGKKAINTINAADIDAYYADREAKFGKPLAYSTVRKHNVTLNRIFDEAETRGFIAKVNIPNLETKGKKSQEYPTFHVEEINVMLACFPPWIERAKKQKSRDQRQLMFDYVRVLLETGARPGKELLNLKWRNIKLTVYVSSDVRIEVDKDEKRWNRERGIKDDDQYVEYVEDGAPVDAEGNQIPETQWHSTVQMAVDGKTGERVVNGYEITHAVMQELVARNYTGKSATTLKKLIKSRSNDLVFVTPEKKSPSSFNHMFEDFLEEHNLLNDPKTNRKRVFYSLRSTYTTIAMNMDAIPIRDMSKQLGNSVGIIQKHYDRATGESIVHNVNAERARGALFRQVEIPDEHKSSKA